MNPSTYWTEDFDGTYDVFGWLDYLEANPDYNAPGAGDSGPSGYDSAPAQERSNYDLMGWLGFDDLADQLGDVARDIWGTDLGGRAIDAAAATARAQVDASAEYDLATLDPATRNVAVWQGVGGALALAGLVLTGVLLVDALTGLRGTRGLVAGR